MEYLINVAMSAVPKLAMLLALWLLGTYVIHNLKKKPLTGKLSKGQKKSIDRWKTIMNISVLVVAAFVVFMAVTTPTNSWKNETFDRQQSTRYIEQQNASENRSADSTITDRSRQPDLSKEERAARFDSLIDYKKD